MPEELGNILNNLSNLKEEVFGDLKIYSGVYKNINENEIFITTAWSGWGKTSAARATTRLCAYTNQEKKIDLILSDLEFSKSLISNSQKMYNHYMNTEEGSFEFIENFKKILN